MGFQPSLALLEMGEATEAAERVIAIPTKGNGHFDKGDGWRQHLRPQVLAFPFLQSLVRSTYACSLLHSLAVVSDSPFSPHTNGALYMPGCQAQAAVSCPQRGSLSHFRFCFLDFHTGSRAHQDQH